MRISTGQIWKLDATLNKITQRIQIGAVSYCVILHIFNASFKLNFFNQYNVCMQNQEPANSKMVFLTYLLPLLITSAASALMDFKSFMFVKDHSTQNNLIDSVPLRASITSFYIFVPYFAASFIITNFIKDFDACTKYLVAVFVGVALMIIRNPIIVTCAFRVNETIQKVNAQEDRERRREIEIHHAKLARSQSRVAPKEPIIPTISYAIERNDGMPKVV